MRIFTLFESVVVCMFLYLAVNLIRYFFFRENVGGGMFGLSDSWIKQERRKK